ncbi:MAG: right-handed parallel beta-helix repeat-containing protein [bacterium]
MTYAKPKVIRMADYGAKPNEQTDTTTAICEAINTAKHLNGKPAVIQFEPGRYLCKGGKLNPDGRTHQPSFNVANLKNVTIDGNGATLVGTDIARLFIFNNCKNITLKNITVDWNPLPHTSGKVVNVLPKEHAFDITPLYPAKPIAGTIVQGILAYNPEKHRLADNGWEIYQTQGERDDDTTLLTPEGNLRIFQRKDTPLPEIGWNVVVRHQVYGYDAFVFNKCENVLLEDVTVNAVPGMAVIGWGSRDITIRRIKVIPAGDGWMSATADAMHFNACRGTITVEDSEFAGMGDDAINIHAMYGLATGRVDDHTLAVARARMHPYYDKVRSTWDAPEKGDIIEYSGGDEPLLPQGQLTVNSFSQDTEQQRTIIKFKEKLPAGAGENTVLTNISTSPKVRISRCKVHSNRARGFLLQTRDVVVNDCIFEDISGAGIQICTDAAEWWESLGSRDVTIKNCIFKRCNFGVAHREAALDIFSDLPKGRQSAAGVHQHLHILDNIFEDNTGAAINVGSADDVEINKNRFATGNNPTVIIMNSRNVTITDSKQLSGKGGVEIRGSSDKATIKIDN